MMLRNIIILVILIIFTALNSGCSDRAKLRVGIINPQRTLSSWGKYNKAAGKVRNEAIVLDEKIAVSNGKLSAEDKKEIVQTTMQWQKDWESLIEEVKKASEIVAKEKKLDLIVLNNVVNYGGVDVTDDVTKKLK